MKHREDVRPTDEHEPGIVPAGSELPTTILQLDGDGYVRASTSGVFGRSLAELIGVRLHNMLMPQAAQQLDHAMQAAGDGGVFRITVRCRGERSRHRLLVARSHGPTEADLAFSVIITATVPSRVEAVPDPPTTAPRGRRLLIAEDEPMLLQLSTRVLNQAGFETTAVIDGHSVLGTLATHQDIGLVVLDLSLPGPATPDLLRQIRTLDPPPHVLLVTGRPLEEVQDLLAGEPMPAHLQKPYSNDLLIETIHRLLDA